MKMTYKPNLENEISMTLASGIFKNQKMGEIAKRVIVLIEKRLKEKGYSEEEIEKITKL